MQDIYTIITHLITGTITSDERQQLDNWLNESTEHKRLFDSFMQRRDLAQIMKIKHRPVKWKSDKWSIFHSSPFVSIAATVLVLVGIFWWKDYTKVIAPELSQECAQAIANAQQSGHSDAEITITAVDANGRTAALGSAKNVADESALGKLLSMAQEKAEDLADEVLQASVQTLPNKEFWITLSDGTRVHLNNATRLTYPVQFYGDNREVTLDGEAYFFVAKDRRHPFIVHTRHGDIKEYGTEFVVDTHYSSKGEGSVGVIKGEGVGVILVEGSISVIPNGGKEKMMKPNDLALLDGTSKEPEIQQVDTTPFTAWNTGTFSFDDCPLDELLTVVSLWYGHEVLFKDNTLRNIRFTGGLDKYESLDVILSSLSKSTSTDIKLVNGAIIVGK